MDYLFPCEVDSENQGEFRVRFPDLPQLEVCCTSVQGVMHKASAALITTLNGYMIKQLDIPTPSRRAPGQRTIYLPTSIEQKLLLYQTMRERGLSYSVLARKLGKTEIMIAWLLDLLKETDPKELRAALNELELT